MPTESKGYPYFLEQAEKHKGQNLSSPALSSPKAFRDNEQVARRLGFALTRSIENLDDELAKFERNFTSSSNRILWAASYEDVFAHLQHLLKSEAAQSVVFPQRELSYSEALLCEEIGLTYFLKEKKIAIHDVVGPRLYFVDYLFAETGSMLLGGFDNQSLRLFNNGGVNIFFVTINHVLGAVSHAELLHQYQMSYSENSSLFPVLSHGRKSAKNYLVIIDNQRINLLSHKALRRSLTCIDCGRCQQVCPVIQVASPEAYNNVFTGPIANVILPFLETEESYRHVPYACTMCGRCEEVCPMCLPLRDMMVEARSYLYSNDLTGKEYRHLLAAYRRLVTNRSHLNAKRFVKMLTLRAFIAPNLKHHRQLPDYEEESFNKQYLNNVATPKDIN